MRRDTAGANDLTWTWVTLRIAAERDDHATLRTALQSRVLAGTGPFARRLHALAVATAACQLGDTYTVARLRTVIDTEDRAQSTLLLPEALARLTLLQAGDNPSAAARDAALLEHLLKETIALPREECPWLLARAELESARGRLAAADADAARSAQIAQNHGLQPLAAIARKAWPRQFESTPAPPARVVPAAVPHRHLLGRRPNTHSAPTQQAS